MIFPELYRNRLMHTGQLQALYGDKMDDRLKRLFDAGYIDWPSVQKMWRHPGVGSRPNVWALSNMGAWALVSAGRYHRSARHGLEREQPPAQALIALPAAHARGQRREGGLSRRLHAPRPDLHSRRAAGPQRARARARYSRPSRPLLTDDTFAIAREGKEPALFFVEADRDTETNIPGVQRGRTGGERVGFVGERLVRRNHDRKPALANSRAILPTPARKNRSSNSVSKTFACSPSPPAGNRGCSISPRRHMSAATGSRRAAISPPTLMRLQLADPFDAPWFDAVGLTRPARALSSIRRSSSSIFSRQAATAFGSVLGLRSLRRGLLLLRLRPPRPRTAPRARARCRHAAGHAGDATARACSRPDGRRGSPGETVRPVKACAARRAASRRTAIW